MQWAPSFCEWQTELILGLGTASSFKASGIYSALPDLREGEECEVTK